MTAQLFPCGRLCDHITNTLVRYSLSALPSCTFVLTLGYPVLLFLHRGFFTQAMTEHPSNPLLSPYRKSVIAAYQSACAVLEDTRVQYQKKPLLCARIWRIWSFAFSAAVRIQISFTRVFAD